MKYRYLIIITIVTFSVALWFSYPGNNEQPNGERYVQSSESAAEFQDIGATLKLLTAQRTIPRIPLKDLFADSSVKKSEDKSEELNRISQAHAVQALEKKKVTSTPRLIGVLIRRSESKAFFIDEDEAYSLRLGDELIGRYRITAINSDKVDIQEMSTGLGRTIYVKDK